MLVDTQDVAYPYNGILFSLKKKGNSDICYNMMNLWIFHLTIRLSEISTKQSISTYARYLEESNPQRQKVEWWLPELGLWVMGTCLMGSEFQFYKMRKLWRYMVVMFAKHYKCV